MKTLVLGGAGYIGSVTAQLLTERGHEVHIIDDLSTGHRAYAKGFSFDQFNMLDEGSLKIVLSRVKPDVVLHFAAKIQVGESIEKPELYFKNNTYGTMLLLEAMAVTGCKNIVFSSTAAVYGEPERVPIYEDDRKEPVNPYGLSKYLSEQMISSYGTTHNLNWTVFRYFNAAGSYKSIAMDYPVMTHLIPHAIEALLGNETLQLFGDDYPTDDGTCVRDFVHVHDIARAHVLAAEKMVSGNMVQKAINLGSGTGYSVKQVLAAVERASGEPVPHVIKPRRPGDPAQLIAERSRAKDILGWEPVFDLEEMVRSHLRWRQTI